MKVIKNIFVMCCVLMFAQIGFASEKIGVVDIQSIVNKSGSVQALKNEYNHQIQSLQTIVTEAQNALARESDPQKIVTIQDRYNNEFNRKKEMIENQYKSKLSIIENSIRQDIINSAKKNNYDFVMAKNMVFFGGDDITDLVLKDIR